VPAAGVNAVQTLTFGAGITGGTFTLTFNGQTTNNITWSSTAPTPTANIQAMLNPLPNNGPNNTPGARHPPLPVTFPNGLGGANQPTMSFNAAGLTGGTITSLATTTTGVAAFTVGGGGTLTLDNTGTNNSNRLNDSISIALNGGTLNFLANNTANTAS